jgi:hypothetical protein
MALQKSLALPSGVSGDYWKVTELVIDYLRPAATCQVALYKDATARQAGAAPLYKKSFVWSDEEAAEEFEGLFDADTLSEDGVNPQSQAYVKLKTLAEFSGATDV